MQATLHRNERLMPTGVLSTLGHAIRHAALLESDAGMLEERLLLGGPLSPQSEELLRSVTASTQRSVAKLARLLGQSATHGLPFSVEQQVLRENAEREAKILREAKPMLAGAEIDGPSFVRGTFFAKEDATAPCEVCGFAVALGMPHEVVGGSPAHVSCVTESEQ